MGSLNKIPLSLAGIVIFQVPTSVPNMLSIFFGMQTIDTVQPPLQHMQFVAFVHVISLSAGDYVSFVSPSYECQFLQ